MRITTRELLLRPFGSAQRALYKSMGCDALARPVVRIANACSTTVPGHFSLRAVADAVHLGIAQGGGTGVESGVPGMCDRGAPLQWDEP